MKRARKGEYVFEELHDGSIVPEKPLYLITRTYRVGFLSFTSFTKVQAMTREEAVDWIQDSLGEDAYAELMVQQENTKGYYEARCGRRDFSPLLGQGNIRSERTKNI